MPPILNGHVQSLLKAGVLSVSPIYTQTGFSLMRNLNSHVHQFNSVRMFQFVNAFLNPTIKIDQSIKSICAYAFVQNVRLRRDSFIRYISVSGHRPMLG